MAGSWPCLRKRVTHRSGGLTPIRMNDLTFNADIGQNKSNAYLNVQAFTEPIEKIKSNDSSMMLQITAQGVDTNSFLANISTWKLATFLHYKCLRTPLSNTDNSVGIPVKHPHTEDTVYAYILIKEKEFQFILNTQVRSDILYWSVLDTQNTQTIHIKNNSNTRLAFLFTGSARYFVNCTRGILNRDESVRISARLRPRKRRRRRQKQGDIECLNFIKIHTFKYANEINDDKEWNTIWKTHKKGSPSYEIPLLMDTSPP